MVLRNHHDPIVSRALFEQAQQELQRRSPHSGKRSKHSGRYCLSGKIHCSACGSTYVSRSKKRKDGSVYKAWRCLQASRYGHYRTNSSGQPIGCNSPSLSENALREILRRIAVNLRIPPKVIEPVMRTVTAVIQADVSAAPFARIHDKIQQQLENKKMRLIEPFLDGDISKADFDNLSDKKHYEQYRRCKNPSRRWGHRFPMPCQQKR